MCDEVVLSNKSSEIKSSEIIYGEKIAFRFINIKGFEDINNHVFPGLQILVLNKDKDTVLYEPDLYADKKEGISNDSFDYITAFITMATPMQSENNYTAYIHIWDKKGNGKFDASLKLRIIPNRKIKVVKNDITFDEIYIYSNKRGSVTNNKIFIDENIHFVFQGLDGFQTDGKKISIGISMEVKNPWGEVLFDEPDLNIDKSLTVSDLKKGLSPYIFFNEKEKGSPLKVKCKIKIWDKKSDKSLEFSTILTLVDQFDEEQ